LEVIVNSTKRKENRQFEKILLLLSFFYPLKKMTNQEILIKLAHTKMPFGKYEGYHLIDLPEYYVVWYANKGFPKGQLGEQLKLVHELKLNGLEELVRNIRRNFSKQ
jgi:uncharacterized protein (DUF3820 family)